MKPNAEFTAPDQRFFYPAGNEIEVFPDAIDLTTVPRTIRIAGSGHYVVYVENGETHAASEYLYGLKVPGGSLIQACRSLPANYKNLRTRYTPEEDLVALQEAEDEFIPPAGSKVILQASYNLASDEKLDPRFDKQHCAILPADEPLPLWASDVGDQRKPHYEIRGFITPDDALVSVYGVTGFDTLLVDHCVANSFTQNRLEAQLLARDVEHHYPYLLGQLRVNQSVKRYLRYYDQKHGTSFLPTEEPTNSWIIEERFGPMTQEVSQRLQHLGDVAYSFMDKTR